MTNHAVATRALRSPHLKRLVELDASCNKLTKAAVLDDPTVVPHVAILKLADNKIPRPTLKNLRRACIVS